MSLERNMREELSLIRADNAKLRASLDASTNLIKTATAFLESYDQLLDTLRTINTKTISLQDARQMARVAITQAEELK